MEFVYKGIRFRQTRRSNAVKLSLSIRRDVDYVSLTVPTHTPQKMILSFLDDNMEWLKEKVKNTDFKPAYLPGEEHCCLGYRVVLGENGVPSGNAFLNWRIQRLKACVNPLIDRYSLLLQVKVKQVQYMRSVAAWGKCQASTGTIRFNWNLAKVPIRCVEFIVAHELCHLIHPNHSPAFYRELEKIMPDWKERSKMLDAFDFTPRPGRSDTEGDSGFGKK